MIDSRVGYAATSVLEELAKEAITTAWVRKDYAMLVEYTTKYEQLRTYNNEVKQ